LPETRLARRFGERLRAGRYEDVWDAAWAFNQELERLRRRLPDAAWLKVRRSRVAVCRKIERVGGPPRVPKPGTSRRPWTRLELRLVDSYARAVARGRYKDAREAAREFQRDMVRIGLRYPRARWPSRPRSFGAIYRVLCRRARVLGRTKFASWTDPEYRLIDRLARRVVDGRCRSARLAAREFLVETARLRDRDPRPAEAYPLRNIRTVHNRVWNRALEMGRPLSAVEWSVPELVVLGRFARRFVAGQYPHVKAAARDCVRAIEKLHQAHPVARWAAMRRSPGATFVKLKEVTHRLVPSWRHSRLTPWEVRILDRYARRLARGRLTIRRATEECLGELTAQHRRLLVRRSDIPWRSPPRSYKAVKIQMVLRSRALGRRKGWAFWSPAEMRIVRKWAERFNATRREWRAFSLTAAARKLQADLRRRGVERQVSVCRARLSKLLYYPTR
jgi:hypothetical protein